MVSVKTTKTSACFRIMRDVSSIIPKHAEQLYAFPGRIPQRKVDIPSIVWHLPVVKLDVWAGDHLIGAHHNQNTTRIVDERIILGPLLCRNVFLHYGSHLLLDLSRIPIDDLGPPLNSNILMRGLIIDHYRNVGVTLDMSVFGAIFGNRKEQGLAIPQEPDWSEMWAAFSWSIDRDNRVEWFHKWRLGCFRGLWRLGYS